MAGLSDTSDSKLRNIVPGAFTPVLAKHTKHLSLVDIFSVGVDRMQRNFEPMRKRVEAWKGPAFQMKARSSPFTGPL